MIIVTKEYQENEHNQAPTEPQMAVANGGNNHISKGCRIMLAYHTFIS